MCKQAIDGCNAHMAYMLAQEGSLDRTRQNVTESRQSRAEESVHQNSSQFREAWKVLQHQIDLDLKALEASVILNKGHDLHRFMARRRMRQMKMAHQETFRNPRRVFLDRKDEDIYCHWLCGISRASATPRICFETDQVGLGRKRDYGEEDGKRGRAPSVLRREFLRAVLKQHSGLCMPHYRVRLAVFMQVIVVQIEPRRKTGLSAGGCAT